LVANLENIATAAESSISLLVHNIRIVYPGNSEDPVFPAETIYDGHWYYNFRIDAGVLGCIERTTTCTPDLTTCENLNYWASKKNGFLKGNSEQSLTLSMMMSSAMTSTIRGALGYRRSETLDAKRKFLGKTSLTLSQKQWKFEVRGFFKASLVRIQIAAGTFAQGIPSESLPDQVDLLEPHQRRIC
jgi:hypothetical protein